MTWRSHTIIAFLSAYTTGVPVIPAMVGGIAPDFDIYFKGKGLFGHRGITHHVLLGTVLILLALFISNVLLSGFVVGYVSHLVADSLTKYGLPYWRNRDRFSFGLFKTGSIGEFVFVYVFAVAVIAVNFFIVKKTDFYPADVHVVWSILEKILG